MNAFLDAAPSVEPPITPDVPVGVTIVNPESPFGGVVIQMPLETVVVGMAPPGSGVGGPSLPVVFPVTSVFSRSGDIVAAIGDYTLDQIGAPVANWILPAHLRIKADGSFQLWNPDQSKWHTLLVHGLAGAEYLTIGIGEA
jgi:hypothetical protein